MFHTHAYTLIMLRQASPTYYATCDARVFVMKMPPTYSIHKLAIVLHRPILQFQCCHTLTYSMAHIYLFESVSMNVIGIHHYMVCHISADKPKFESSRFAIVPHNNNNDCCFQVICHPIYSNKSKRRIVDTFIECN